VHAARLRLASGGGAGTIIIAADQSAARGAERALRQAEEIETARQIAQARLNGVRLTARSTAHLVNNSLAEAVGYLDLLQVQKRFPAEALAMVGRAQQSIAAAADHIARLQQVVRVETWETPAGAALDRSASHEERSA
jgi:hypothetical protein